MRSLARMLALLVCLTPSAASFAAPVRSPVIKQDPAKLFAEAEAAYQAGRFRDAIDRLKEAQAIAPDPILLYNLARAHEALGELEEARDAYRSFIQADPKTTDRGAIEGRIRSLEGLIAERERKSQPDPSLSSAPKGAAAESEKSASAFPWVLAGVGVAGLGVGGLLGGLSLSASSEAEDATTSGLRASELSADADAFALGANVSFGVGAAIAIAGVIWGSVDLASLEGKTNEVTARVQVGPSGARLVLAF